MELRQIGALEAVLETGSFAAAARQRAIAQPALWAQVKTLERELGVALFERDGRRVRPTRAARLVRSRLRLILDDARALESLAVEIRQGRAAPARIGCAETHVPYFLAGCIARLLHRFPEAPFPQIVPVTSATVDEALARGDVDLMVHTRAREADTEGCYLYPVWIAAVGPCVRGRTLDVRALDRKPVATLPPDSGVRAILNEACAAAGVTPDIVHEHRSAASLLALARHGLATAVIISEAVPSSEAARAARLCSGKRRFGGDFWLQWRREETLSTAARQLRDIMREEAARLRMQTASNPRQRESVPYRAP